VYVHIPKQKRRKWDVKSKRGIFVGYGAETKGYRVFFQDSHSVEISRDVIFGPMTSDKSDAGTKVSSSILSESELVEQLVDNEPEHVADMEQEANNFELVDQIVENEPAQVVDMRQDDNEVNNDNIVDSELILAEHDYGRSANDILLPRALRDRCTIRQPSKFDDFVLQTNQVHIRKL
jgi:hypothetical protein